MDDEQEQPQQDPPAASPAPEPVSPSAPAAQSVDLGKVRALVLAAHPDVVAELVGGETFDAILASVEPARAAYQRITQQVAASVAAAAQHAAPAAPASPPAIPAGQPGRGAVTLNVEELSSSAKIAEGLKRRSASVPGVRA